jgi:hypothetical protein
VAWIEPIQFDKRYVPIMFRRQRCGIQFRQSNENADGVCACTEDTRRNAPSMREMEAYNQAIVS